MAMNLASSTRRRGARGSRRAPMAEINVTPFVDVMLVLLIIFMVTAPLLSVGVPLELPDSRAKPLGQKSAEVTISLNSEGVVFVNERAVPDGGLPAAVAALNCASSARQPQITFRGDRAVDYGRTMAVLGELNRAGCSSVALVTGGSAAQP
jgi:biopolymer transport protein TolR